MKISRYKSSPSPEALFPLTLATPSRVLDQNGSTPVGGSLSLCLTLSPLPPPTVPHFRSRAEHMCEIFIRSGQLLPSLSPFVWSNMHRSCPVLVPADRSATQPRLFPKLNPPLHKNQSRSAPLESGFSPGRSSIHIESRPQLYTQPIGQTLGTLLKGSHRFCCLLARCHSSWQVSMQTPHTTLLYQNILQISLTCCTLLWSSMQPELSAAAAREVARREKARLRELQKQKRENMERMREQQNKLAEAEDVCSLSYRFTGSLPPHPACPPGAYLPRRSLSCALCLSQQANRGKARLNFLLQQAEIFQHFAPPEPEKSSKKKGR